MENKNRSSKILGWSVVAVGATALGYYFRHLQERKTSRSQENVEREWHSGPHHKVDQASWESFPASDPPAY